MNYQEESFTIKTINEQNSIGFFNIDSYLLNSQKYSIEIFIFDQTIEQLKSINYFDESYLDYITKYEDRGGAIHVLQPIEFIKKLPFYFRFSDILLLQVGTHFFDERTDDLKLFVVTFSTTSAEKTKIKLNDLHEAIQYCLMFRSYHWNSIIVPCFNLELNMWFLFTFFCFDKTFHKMTLQDHINEGIIFL
jgi:hypothetical protein